MQEADQRVLGPVLLVPGYGGTTADLQPLAARLQAAGRTVVVVDLPAGGTGDLRAAARALGAAAAGAPTVDVVGYSAGGVLARLYAVQAGASVRRVITLGSPHHGTKVAALAEAFASAACPLACQQLVPGSSLLRGLADTPRGPSWVSLWSSGDEVVTPPDSARLRGALDLVLQDVCPGEVAHGDLPTTPFVIGLVLQELAPGPTTAPGSCQELTAAGR